MRTTFSTGDIRQIAKIHSVTLDNWIAKGLIAPKFGGTHKGDHRFFGLIHVFAIFVGTRYREEQAGDERISGVVRFLGGLELEWLEAELAAGRTFPVPATLLGRVSRPVAWLPGLLVEPPSTDDLTPTAADLMRRLDLAHLYHVLRERIDRLQDQGRLGRKRGRKARFVRT